MSGNDVLSASWARRSEVELSIIMNEDVLHLLEECQTPEDLAAIEALAAELPVQTEPRILRTLGEVAAFFGFQPNTVRAWRMESPPLPGVPGRYVLDEIETWKAQRDARNEVPGMAELNIASQRAELARRLESVRSRRTKNDRLENSVIRRTELERDIRAGVSMLEARLRRLPTEIVAKVPQELSDATQNEVMQTVNLGLAGLQNELTKRNNLEAQSSRFRD